MKKMIILFLLLFAFSCEDNDDSFSIIGKWQYTHKLKSSGEWQSIDNGDRFDFKSNGMIILTSDYTGKDTDEEISYTFDESNLNLKINFRSNNIWEYTVVIESNKIMYWTPVDDKNERMKVTRI